MRLAFVLILITCAALPAATYELKATPSTVAWGYYDAAAKPVLRIKSGDTVTIQTLLTNSPAGLRRAGVPAEQIEQSLRDIYAQVKDKGPGGHILTGPIYIEDAEPGDALEVRIESIKLALPYAYNAFSPRFGFLPEDFTYAHTKIVPLDEKRMVAHFAAGIDVPLHPFFGSMGVAPPPEMGKVSSGPPGIHAGNLDNKHLVAGTTLFIPVHAPGALFEVGDGHVAQGNGEIDITALETSLVGTFQFIVRKDLHLHWPRAETPTHYIMMGIDKDLTEAAKIAARETIDFLVNEKHLTRSDAYMLASVAADFEITQLVDGTKGVHAMIPKALFTGPSTRPASVQEPLHISWAKDFLTIRGGLLGDNSVRVHYLEAYCRSGSTNRKWNETVIPHKARLVQDDPQGRKLIIEDTLADDVTVHHEITASADEVDFRLTAHNPTAKTSEAHWAQPCIRTGQFTGFADNSGDAYLPKCFIFLDGKLSRMPTPHWTTKGVYTPGQVWCPKEVSRDDVNPRPLSEDVPSNGLIGCFSADEKAILATAWEPYQELFQGVAACIHSDFRVGGLKAGETKNIRGKIYIVPADVGALLARYERDFPAQAAKEKE